MPYILFPKAKYTNLWIAAATSKCDHNFFSDSAVVHVYYIQPSFIKNQDLIGRK